MVAEGPAPFGPFRWSVIQLRGRTTRSGCPSIEAVGFPAALNSGLSTA